jgi:Tol biopolymer transport system component
MLGAISAALMLTATACGSATPTRVPPTATVISVAQASPTVGAAPTLPATPTLVVTTTVTATVATTTTKIAQFVTPTTAGRTAARTATPKPPAAPPNLSGHIFFSVVFPGDDYKFRTLWSAGADGSSKGQILQRVMWPTISLNGSQVAFFQPYDGIFIVNPDGGGTHQITSDGGVCCLNFSPDGNWIAFVQNIKQSQPGGAVKKLKMDGVYKTIVDLGVQGNAPAFSPDGTQVAFAGCQSNSSTCGIFVVGADGGSARVLTTDAGGLPQWSRDGKRIVYQASEGGHFNVFTVNADGTGRKQLTKGAGQDGQPIFSKDGAHIFWRSDQNGTSWAIFVMNADGTGARKVINDVPPSPDFWAWEPMAVGP